jgi:hypothetical protein
LRPSRARMAAPKSLQPDETPLRVKGMIDSSTVLRIADTSAAGDSGGESVAGGMSDFGVLNEVLSHAAIRRQVPHGCPLDLN